MFSRRNKPAEASAKANSRKNTLGRRSSSGSGSGSSGSGSSGSGDGGTTVIHNEDTIEGLE